MSQFDPNNLDVNVVNLAKAMRQVESGNRAVLPAEGAELGGASRYQYTTGTWKGVAQKYLGDANAPLTAKNEDQVTYMRVKDWKDAGKTPKQIASMWNAGEGEPDAYTGKFKSGKSSIGVNDYGVKYNVPAHTEKVYAEFVKNSKSNPPKKTVQPNVVGEPEQPKDGIFKSIGKAIISSETGLANTFGGALGVMNKDFKAAQESQTALDDMNVKLGQAIVAGKKSGKDTSRLEKLYQENTNQIFNPSEITSGAIDKTPLQVAGEVGGVALDVATGGTYGNLAKGAKTGQLLTKSPLLAKGAEAIGLGVTKPLAEKLVTPTALTPTAKMLSKLPVVGSEMPKYGTIAKEGVKAVGTGLGIGYGYDVTQNLQAGKTGLEAVTPGLGTAIGGAIPTTIAGIRFASLSGRKVAPRVINSLIGANPEFNKAVRMGKDPGETVAKYGIVANTIDEFEQKISQTRKEVGEILGNAYKLPENAIKVADYSDVPRIIDNEIKSIKFSESNAPYIEKLQKAKRDILTNYQDLTKLTPEEAHRLKQDIASLRGFDFSQTKNSNFNSVVNRMYGNITNRVNSLIPELAGLNKDFSGLMAAELSASSKADRLAGRNLITPFGKFGMISGTGIGLATGGVSFIPILAGIGGAALDKLLGTTAVKTRFAKFLSGATSAEKQALLRGKTLVDQRAILKTAKELGFDFSKEVEKNAPKNLLLKQGDKSMTGGTISLPPRTTRLSSAESGVLPQPYLPPGKQVARPGQLQLSERASQKPIVTQPPTTYEPRAKTIGRTLQSKPVSARTSENNPILGNVNDKPFRLSDVSDKNGFVYHQTSPESLDGIKKSGLKANTGISGKGVYFSPYEGAGASANAAGDGVILRTKANKLYSAENNRFDAFPGEESVFYGNIPTDLIEVKKGNKWMPLKNSPTVGETAPTKLYRAGELKDVRGTGIFLSDNPKMAKQYENTASGGKVVNDYNIGSLNLKETSTRNSLLKELDPTWDRSKTYDKFIREGFSKGNKQTGIYDGLTAEQRLQNYTEKRIKQLLEKQGYDGVKYSGGSFSDQAGEYQIFNPSNIKSNNKNIPSIPPNKKATK